MYIKSFEIKLITGFLKLLVAMRMENVNSEINTPSTLFHIMHWSVRILMFVSVFEVKIIFNVILFLILTFFFGCMACGILVPQPGIKSIPPTLEVRSLNHWTATVVSLTYLNIISKDVQNAIVFHHGHTSRHLAAVAWALCSALLRDVASLWWSVLRKWLAESNYPASSLCRFTEA